MERFVRPVVDFVLRFAAPLLAPIVNHMARTGIGSDAFLRLGWMPIQVAPLPNDEYLERVAPALAPVIARMARTGAGSDACLKRDCLPVPVNFYSPIPDLPALERRRVWDRRSDLAGIDFRVSAQLDLLASLGRESAHECDWSPQPGADSQRFFTENGAFSYGCAASTHCILRRFKPRRVIECGSGHSSRVIAATLALNAAEPPAEYTIVDPFPCDVITRGLPGVTTLLKQGVESLDVKFFERLEQNDLLFIDTGHTARIGSDVNFLILDVLPRLAPGVLVHLHDIALPFEYPRIYATNPRFRQFWTEAYLLQAFLCFNDQFEILLALNYLMTKHAESFRAAFPLYDPARHLSGSSSFWIRRK